MCQRVCAYLLATHATTCIWKKGYLLLVLHVLVCASIWLKAEYKRNHLILRLLLLLLLLLLTLLWLTSKGYFRHSKQSQHVSGTTYFSRTFQIINLITIASNKCQFFLDSAQLIKKTSHLPFSTMKELPHFAYT